MTPHYADDSVTLYHGDCLDVLRTLPDASVDAVCTDPPYGLEFMGRAWDSFKTVPSGGAGIKGTGYTDGADRLDRPSFTGSPNPSCRNCRGTQRGADGQGVRRCRCDAPDFPNVRRAQSAAFQTWCEQWTAECLRVLKPGGHLLAFGGTRTWHRLACAVEDAGFEVRDSIAWLYGSGFPKSLDVSKAIDKAARGVPQGGADPTSPHHGKYRTTTTEGKRWDGDSGQGYGAGGSRFLADGTASGSDTEPAVSGAAVVAPDAARWQGWGTALKPAFEPIVVARKPLASPGGSTVAANVLAHGTGALNIDGCRIGDEERVNPAAANKAGGASLNMSVVGMPETEGRAVTGRWPANVVLDESQADALDQQSGERPGMTSQRDLKTATPGDGWGRIGHLEPGMREGFNDTGGASRFFYTAKADSGERVRINGVSHPTVKPLSLMRWLVRLVTPPGGTVLEPFAGSGTTVEACILEGFRCIAIEREADYLPLITQRLHRRLDPVQAVRSSGDDGGLFDLLDVERREVSADTRLGEASADRRYTAKGGTNFAMKPGRRYRDGGAA